MLAAERAAAAAIAPVAPVAVVPEVVALSSAKNDAKAVARAAAEREKEVHDEIFRQFTYTREDPYISESERKVKLDALKSPQTREWMLKMLETRNADILAAREQNEVDPKEAELGIRRFYDEEMKKVWKGAVKASSQGGRSYRKKRNTHSKRKTHRKHK